MIWIITLTNRIIVSSKKVLPGIEVFVNRLDTRTLQGDLRPKMGTIERTNADCANDANRNRSLSNMGSVQSIFH